jgi:hypothetical protein
MEISNELEFIYRLNLRNSRKHTKGFNFSCDFCRDTKRRAYLLISYDKIVCYCHNCNSSLSFRKFVELANPALFEDYKLAEQKHKIEALRNGTVLHKKHNVLTTLNSGVEDLKLFKLNEKYFIPAKEVPECVEYCKKRKFPEGVIDKLKYCTHPKLQCGGHLVFPCYWKDGEHVYAFQSRSMKDKRFYIHSKNESFKVAGIFQVDLTKTVYIFESIIDSYYKQNSIAAMGAAISQQVLNMIPKDNICFCFDNDEKGVSQSLKYAEAGYKVLVWDSSLKWAKDPNELAVKGEWNPDMIERMVLNNIKTGFGAMTALKIKMGGKKAKWNSTISKPQRGYAGAMR